MNQQIILAVVIGIVAGALFVWLLNRSSRDDGAAREKFDKLQKEFETYRGEVNAHFAQTADAVDQLTQSYQNVFSHLSDGAQKLMDKEALKAQLEKRQGKAVTLAYLVDEQGEKAPTAVPGDSVVVENTAEAPAEVPAAGAETQKVLHYAADPSAPGKIREAQKSGDNGSRVLTYPAAGGDGAQAENADNPPANPEHADKAGAEKKPEPAAQAAPAATDAEPKRSVEIAAENAGLNLSPKTGEIGAGETSLEAVKRHLREQNPPAPKN